MLFRRCYDAESIIETEKGHAAQAKKAVKPNLTRVFADFGSGRIPFGIHRIP